MDENELIDKLNSLQAQNIALTQALATLVQLFPSEAKGQLKSLYEMRCATFQTSVTLGNTEPDALQIQRDQFARVRNLVFGA